MSLVTKLGIACDNICGQIETLVLVLFPLGESDNNEDIFQAIVEVL